ncbi:helix-turn-helix domain-containing protein [Streptomyces griseocarneus]|uniref:helix-turn-helix domain-containing protein n=1 Tax=Streptomyces griseocarneus TaxID=51201 RepID=UPI00167C7B29|nr:helix-turn-helix domain-containing protein [Streptomyces griseocarneus]MBZ6475206.1 helix-turn-helix domain-containing protein [Streptomyces griseocarneus]GHG61665.1 hypothetical protein GCM10018779_29740 [Streptomyces griseocarneus]
MSPAPTTFAVPARDGTTTGGPFAAACVPLECLPAPGHDGVPAGRVTTHALGGLGVSTVRGPALTLASAPGPSGTGSADRVVAAVHRRGLATFVQHGRAVACAPGDLVVLDARAPFAFHEAEDFELHLFGVPRHLLGLPPADVEALCRPHPLTRGSVAPLLAPYLQELAAPAAAHSPKVAEHLAAAAVELLATLAAEARASTAADAGSGRHALALRLRAHVNENLWDRALTPESIAEHHHISVRYLHAVFAAEGSTVSRWIQRRRLEECRRELARTGRTRPAVASVAKRWGFANAAHFSRAFRTAYGMSPSTWRALRTPGAPGESPEG